VDEIHTSKINGITTFNVSFYVPADASTTASIYVKVGVEGPALGPEPFGTNFTTIGGQYLGGCTVTVPSAGGTLGWWKQCTANLNPILLTKGQVNTLRVVNNITMSTIRISFADYDYMQFNCN
jgi:hypothetical protein